MSILSSIILTSKTIALVCLLASIYSYHWFDIDNYSTNKDQIQYLCLSYGAFCNVENQMPLPRLIVITPCVFLIISILLEIINLSILYSKRPSVPSLLNYFLEQTSIALSCAITIHCIWVTIVHIRISMEMRMIHLDGTFFAFGLATILVPIDCTFSIIRIMNHCQYDEGVQINLSARSSRHKSAVECVV
ncbi:unnamed protein product [Rotaria magnacalcarata]|uniref:Uncharacterized protein n=1 Tax=Rotaria magnacalcarata TaxID=392030 RepID=A0A816YAH8_9BILA|nr:unnamed protein product [Rotaria magnacalcarata]CAF1404325.1 unnamed protein product [Rotaria magnacalcarata]CAF2045943.1 unnamed protein product [Rotaria magnacalcarata]CAF2154380.1 unnamed protein product [Rotaria magnacalcarata]CAF3968605.1 unnamed protein product [Rotaria magnacalcarata]